MQKRTEEVVLTIAKGVSTVAGHIFFNSLMEHLSKSLGADYAFVGELMKGHPGRVRTLVVWGHGRLVDNFEYDLAGTPCADVVRQRPCGYGSGIQQLFPLDQLLADMGVEGYVGAPLRDTHRRTLGLLVVMFQKPVDNLALAESILNIFGVRAASELERQQKEEALRESEQRLGLVLEATSSGVWDWNLQTGEVYFDDRWLKSLGYSREDVSLHVSFWEQIIHPEDLPLVRMALRDHFQGRSLLYECENRLRTKSGTYRPNLDRGKVVEWDADGRPLRMVGTNTDITNRKQMEDQLRLTQFAIDRAADAIFIADTNKRFLYVNNEACRSLEYTRDELMELTVFEIAPSHETETFGKRLQILKEAGVVRYETIHRTKSGRDIPVDLTINLFELNGTILMCGVARDITKRKQMDEVLQALAVETASVTGGESFPVLVRQLAAAVGTRYAFVTELVGDEQARVQVLAIWMGDRLGAPFEYNLIHTPCKVVFDQGSAYHPDSVQEVYPNYKNLVALEAMAYLGVTLKDSSGKPIGHLCVLDDKPLLNKNDSLTLMNVFAARAAAELERKRAEQEQYRLIEDLKRSQQHFQALFNWTHSAVGISTVTEGRFIDVNDGFSRLTGYAREEVIGRTTLELGLWADPEERAFVLREILEQGYLHNREGLLRTKSGEIRSLMVSVESIQLGSTPCLIYLGHDITARKQAEEALRESQGRFRELAENIKEVFWMSDPQKNEILYVSPAYEQIWGRTCESLYASPRSWLEAVHTEDRARILNAAVTKQAAGTYDEEYRVVQPAGSMRWIHDRAFPVRDAAGMVCRIVGIAEDITERKQAEGQVQQSLEQLRELTGQLEMAEELERKRIARELHDEFGQMITALKLDLTWLSNQHRQAGDEQQAAAFSYRLEAMKKVVDTMAQSTRRIASSLRPSVLDDLGLVPALQWQARDFQERTGLECEIRLSADVAQRQIVDTTATALFRIAQELLTNIIRHANAQRVQISLAADGDVLAMIVTDDGKGITENDLAKPTSFGLRGIRERVALIGGEIKIDSAPHQGTIVTLRVPLTRQGKAPN